jgi:hypothetical protein
MAVPDNTIKKTWDAFSQNNFQGVHIGAKPPGVTQINNQDYHDKHTTQKCSRRNLRGQCKNWVQEGSYQSGKVPIGAYAEIYDGPCGKFRTNYIKYGQGDYKDVANFPPRLLDNVATNCAGGSGLNWNEYPTKNLMKFNDHTTETTDKCFIGQASATYPNTENCFRAAVDYPVFCQMGDYINSVGTCKEQCKGSNSLDQKNNYCNFAYERLCGKTLGDPLKKNNLNAVITSSKNYITEPECVKYCGYADEDSNNMCKEHKKNYCIKHESWPGAAEYCFDYWNKFPNTLQLNQACGDKLVDNTSSENITTGKGCGFLCRGGNSLDVHKGYCNTKRLEYCTTGDNMETRYCYEFCKDNPDLCELYLQNEYCTDKKDKLDLPVGSEGLKYSDYCGCMMDTQFYEDYVNNVFKQFKEGGYDIEGIGNIKTEPECIYPKCKSGSILTSAQANNIKNCGHSCVQIMLNTFNNSEIDGNFLSSQSANCALIHKTDTDPEPPPPVSSIEPPPGSGPASSSAPPASSSAPPASSGPPASSSGPPASSSSPEPPIDDPDADFIEDEIVESERDEINSEQSGIIGGIVVVLLLLAIGIGLAIYFLRKKE